jgi:hypothetical protein
VLYAFRCAENREWTSVRRYGKVRTSSNRDRATLTKIPVSKTAGQAGTVLDFTSPCSVPVLERACPSRGRPIRVFYPTLAGSHPMHVATHVGTHVTFRDPTIDRFRNAYLLSSIRRPRKKLLSPILAYCILLVRLQIAELLRNTLELFRRPSSASVPWHHRIA